MRARLLIPVVAVSALLAAGCGSSKDKSSGSQGAQGAYGTAAVPSGPPTVTRAEESEWAIKLVADKVKPATPGGTITIGVANVGKVKHELVIVKTDKQADQLGSGTTVPEDGSVGEVSDIPSGQTRAIALKLAPGHYALICNIPSHYKLGMHTDLTVE